MSKSLVAYFSAEAGRTKSIAESLSRKVEADLFEIVPDPPHRVAAESGRQLKSLSRI